jgi:hypothetical protein
MTFLLWATGLARAFLVYASTVSKISDSTISVRVFQQLDIPPQDWPSRAWGRIGNSFQLDEPFQHRFIFFRLSLPDCHRA